MNVLEENWPELGRICIKIILHDVRSMYLGGGGDIVNLSLQDEVTLINQNSGRGNAKAHFHYSLPVAVI